MTFLESQPRIMPENSPAEATFSHDPLRDLALWNFVHYYERSVRPKKPEYAFQGEYFDVIKAMEYDPQLPTIVIGLGIDINNPVKQSLSDIYELADQLQGGASAPKFNVWIMQYKVGKEDLRTHIPLL